MAYLDYTDETLMPFGKHQNKKLANVPASYLLYLFNSPGGLSNHPRLKDYIEKNKEALELEVKKKSKKVESKRQTAFNNYKKPYHYGY